MTPLVSIVVPTYCEAVNLEQLIRELDALSISHHLSLEIIVVDDDSPDGTAELCERLSEFYPVRCLVRKQMSGLSSAVIDGMAIAIGRILVVMDADLSHPPDAIPAMVAAIIDKRADFVVGSRYVSGGSTEDRWGWHRRVLSEFGRILSYPLAPINDPTSGFFALSRSDFVAHAHRLSPFGYKIGLELLVKLRPTSVIEVPIFFRQRRAGQSKLSLAEMLHFARHLLGLYLFCIRERHFRRKAPASNQRITVDKEKHVRREEHGE